MAAMFLLSKIVHAARGRGARPGRIGLAGLAGLMGAAASLHADPVTETAATAAASEESHTLPSLAIYSPRVANQESTASFAMPVTALRYEPLVDVQSRSTGEAQADVSIRGGTFENTGFSIGAVPLYDSQTGHYSAELPVAPAMLGAPQVRTGAANAQAGWGATAGSVGYAWQPVSTGGFVSAGTGNDSLLTGELYAGVVSPRTVGGYTVAADVSAAASQGDGPVTFSDHDFVRYNGRIQIRDARSQTDLFAGYQSKEFAWPNLYAARNVDAVQRLEREELQTQLFVANHRVELGADGDWFQAGAWYRRNRDHYSIPDFSYDAHHRTIVRGAGFDGRVTVAGAGEGSGGRTTAIRYRAGVVADDLWSTELNNGDYNSRTQVYAGVFGDQTFGLADGAQELVLTAGVNYDDSNRAGSAFSPVAEIAWRRTPPASSTAPASAAGLQRVYLSYDQSTQLPTYTALNSSPTGLFGGDPDLGRSKAFNLELGADVAAAGWTATAAVFFRRDDDLVDWVFAPTTPGSRMASAVDLDTWGVELVARRSWRAVDFVAGYSWLHKTDNYTTAGLSSFYALNYAEHRLTAAVTVRLGGGFEVRCDNEFRVQEENDLRETTRTPFFTSLGLYWHVPRVSGLTVSAQVDNLWDVDYQEVPLVPGTPRTWSTAVTYAW